MAGGSVGLDNTSGGRLMWPFSIRHFKWVVVSGVTTLVTFLVVNSTIIDWYRQTEPPLPVTLGTIVTPTEGGRHMLTILVRAQPSKVCVRVRADVLVRVDPTDDSYEFVPLDTNLSGRLLGLSGNFKLYNEIPASVRGMWYLHTRFMHICTVAEWLPPKIYFRTAPITTVYFGQPQPAGEATH